MKKYFVKVLILKDRRTADIIQFFNYCYYYRDIKTKTHFLVNRFGTEFNFSFNDYTLVGEFYEKKIFR